jgi:hypothetical protein
MTLPGRVVSESAGYEVGGLYGIKQDKRLGHVYHLDGKRKFIDRKYLFMTQIIFDKVKTNNR